MRPLITAAIILLWQIVVPSQTWRNYFNFNDTKNAVINKDILWVATPGGLVKYDQISKDQLLYNKENGNFPCNNIDHVLKDSSGNIYFCSTSIYRYDGINVTNLLPVSRPLTKVTDSNINKKGEIWFTELWEGILIYNGVNWRQIKCSDFGLSNAHCFCLRHDKRGNTWIGTNYGLVKFDGSTFTIYNKTNSGLKDNSINTIAVDKENNIWLATENNLEKYDGQNWTYFNKSNSNIGLSYINNVAVDSSGNIWVSDLVEGVSKYNGIDWKFFPTFKSNSQRVNNITVDSTNNIWISTEYGLYKLKNDIVEKIDITGSALPSNIVKAITFDKLGRTCVGTIHGAAYIKNTLHNEIQSSTYPVNTYDFTSSTVDSSGNVWLGFNGGLVKCYDDNFFQYDMTNSSLPDPNISCLTTDKGGNIWGGHIGTLGGVFEINDTKWNIYDTASTGLSLRVVTDIVCSGDGTIWVSTYNNGIFNFSNNKWTNFTTNNSSIPSNTVKCLAIDKNNKLYVGTSKGLVTFFENKFSSLKNSYELMNNDIKDIVLDKLGILWATIDGYGLLKYTGTGLTQYLPDNSGIPYQYLNKIEVDKNNNLWIATDCGLSEFNENGIVTDVDKSKSNSIIPESFFISQNYPNPFNPSTTIKYSIPVETRHGASLHVTLKVYDVLGREVVTLVNETKQPDNYEVKFNGANLPSGVYFYKLTAGEFVQTKKLMLIK